MRDDQWLKEKLEQIWVSFFPDVKRGNKVVIRFKGKSRDRFGYIKKVNENTLIVINSLFRDERVPDFIIYNTIVHELVHYMHGFQSPLERKHKYPHKGGVVDKELRKRGFDSLLKKEKEWARKEWGELYKEMTYQERKENSFFNRFI